MTRSITWSVVRRHLSTAYPKSVRIVEVGPRDGLQNISASCPTDVKLNFIDRLVKSGLRHVEATSFVSPRWIPQLADHYDIMQELNRRQYNAQMSVLVPNLTGLDRALECQVGEVAVFIAASEGFSQKNTNCSIAKSLANVEVIFERLQQLNSSVRVRGYVSCIVQCPYDGRTDPAVVASLTQNLLDLGCFEVSLGDTIGIATPGHIETMLQTMDDHLHFNWRPHVALHCHNTYGQALANCLAGLRSGITTFDASTSGLGGCPYAGGRASGNVATEDLVYMLHGMDIDTDIDLKTLVQTSKWISAKLGLTPQSHLANLANIDYIM